MARKGSDPETQHKLFVEAARELGCNEDEEAFERALRQIGSHRPPAEDKPEMDTKKPAK